MSYFILIDNDHNVYISTLHLWYSSDYLLNLFVSISFNWLAFLNVYQNVILFCYNYFIYLTL